MIKKFFKGFLFGVGFSIFALVFIDLFFHLLSLIFNFAKSHHLNSSTMFAISYTLICGIFFGIITIRDK